MSDQPQQPNAEQPAGQPRPMRASSGKRALLVLATLPALFVAYMLLWPAPIDPVAYSPPSPPECVGVLAPNEELKKAQLLGVGRLVGPEDVDVDAEGRVYGGTIDGKIMRITPDGNVETFAATGGRPLGLHFDADGDLIVADAIKGLLAVDPQGNVTPLVTEAGGTPLGFTDDLDIASDAAIYFSDASSKFGVGSYMYDLLEARGHGRLLRFDPATGKVDVLLDELYFANGVALSQNEDFVLVNETARYRIRRYWLKGERKGTADVFIDNLPGFPDGVSSNRRGTFWVAVITLRNEQFDAMSPKPFVKKMVSKLPEFLLPRPRPYGLVLGVNEGGRIVRSLHDTDGAHLQEITSVEEHEGHLYLGSLHNDRIGKYALAAQ